MPNTVSSGSGMPSVLIWSPSSRPSNGRVTMERPPCVPPGASA